jgi:uncharacterized 2Fe-2S/4Fe-4S cluster protein (DUF4445 family)
VEGNLRPAGSAGPAGERTCTAEPGETILAALSRGGIILSAPCGGRGLCGKCGVVFIGGSVSPAAGNSGIFLACQTAPASDIHISLVSGNETPVNETYFPESPAGRIEPGTIRRAALALDIGTTTISARLLDLDTGFAADIHSELNDQRSFGADVMSRINAAKNGKTGELFTAVNRQVEGIIRRFIEKNELSSIDTLAVSGNTVMLHLFMNTDPSSMGELPFTPVFLEGKELAGSALNLSVNRVQVLPSISAFIGADITAGLAVLNLFPSKTDAADAAGTGEDTLFFIDIGTNGEMALLHGGRLFCCSTAAGPAFEGAEISCGMGGVAGAINRVEERRNEGHDSEEPDGGIIWTTIGNVPPRGICGCGLIDAVALMLRRGIIDETGAFTIDEGTFTIAPGISLNQRDIRQFQLAKGAIRSGVHILCKNAGIEVSEVSRVFIAGGLGFFIREESTLRTGLLPPEFRGKIAVCGNLSLKGAQRSLMDENFGASCIEVIERSTVVELASDPAFMDAFAEHMLFEE